LLNQLIAAGAAPSVDCYLSAIAAWVGGGGDDAGDQVVAAS